MKSNSRFLLLALPAAGLLVWVGASAAQEKPGYSVCRHRKVDGTGARPVDLAKVDAEYTKAAEAFRERVKKVEAKTVAFRGEGFESGVKGCARNATRAVRLSEALPASFRSRRILFLRAAPKGPVPAGVAVPLGRESVVFVLGYARQEDVGRLAERLGANVSQGTAQLAARFDVRCASSVVEVGKDGRTLEIQEIVP
jgi:hypothetical protein